MAFFLRTRQLDLKRLDRKPQENLEVVHAILEAAIKEAQDKLGRVERAYYGMGKNVHDELAKWSGPVRSVMAVVHMSVITSQWQVDEIIKQASNPSRTFTFDMYELNKLKTCYRKISEAVPGKFADIVVDLKTILKYLEKYCLSFYDLDTDVDLETAVHYEKQRREQSILIRENLDNINKLVEKFRHGKLFISDFSSYSIQLGRRGECTSVAFLLMFPEACENLRKACSAMMSWVNADSNYAEFIGNDITDLELKKEESLKTVRECQQKYHTLSFRLKQLQSQCETMTVELEKLQSKENELIIDEECLNTETNDMQLEIEIKEYRRDELVKNSANIHPEILYEKFSELSEDLRELKMRLPFATRSLASVKHKLEWLEGKQQELAQEQKKLAQVCTDIEATDQSRIEYEVEHQRIIATLELAKKIKLYKSSCDAMEKIYHERPVEANKARLPGQKGKDDPFERACHVTCGHIENDWPRLYRALQFHPPRGVTTIDRDIRELTNLTSRLSPCETALRCLYRWRRHHTRAKVEDLMDALAVVKRTDILEKLHEELDPPPTQEVVEEEIPAYIEEYLLPFLKQVERFDELRAANKI